MAMAFLVVGSIALAQSGASAPATGNIAVRDGINPGEVVVSWDAVPGATHYRIGYVNMVTDYPRATASVTGDWINAFIYVDENARNLPVANGRAEYTVRRLEQGVSHVFTVLTSSNFIDTGGGGTVSSTFAWPPTGSRWQRHTVADRGGATAPAPGFDFVSMYPNCDAVRAHYPGGVRIGSPIYRPALDRDGDGVACEATDTTPQPQPVSPMAMIQSSSTSASATVQLTLTIPELPNDLVGGSSIVLYLEDDFNVDAEGDGIDRDTVYFTAFGGSAADDHSTGNGRRVYATDSVEIDTDDHFTAGKDDWDIQVFIPDMNTSDVDQYAGFDGPKAGQTLTLTFTKAAGIRNPSEAGTHNVGYSILGPVDSVGEPQYKDADITGAPLSTFAKITLSDPDNARGYIMTVTGSGFSHGISAAAYVLHDSTVSYVPSGDAEKALCRRIISEATLAGHSVVGSDGRVAVTFEVTVPPFGPGGTNYICMVDGTGLMSDTDVEVFRLEPSIWVAPSAARVGDIVTVFAQDFSNPGAAFVRATLAGRPVSGATATSVRADGSATATFAVPTGVIGIVRLEAEWGGISQATNLRIVP